MPFALGAWRRRVSAAAPNAEDIHHFVEMQLTKLIGDLALKLHTGRSRNEQIATDMRLYVRDAIDATVKGLGRWALALVTLAEQSGEAVMPSYTHMQRAEPVLVAHWLLAYVSMIERGVRKPTLDVAARIAEALKVGLPKLIAEAQQRRGSSARKD